MSNIGKTLVIDAGGSKTRAFLISEGDVIQTETINQMGNLYFSEEITKDSFQKILKLFKLEEIEKINISLAGYSDSIESHKQFKNFLKKITKIEHFDIYNDILFLSKFIKNDPKIIVGILGTGSSYLINDKSELKTLGGWGHLLGDEGSSYSFAINAIRIALEDLESGNTKFSDYIFELFQVNSLTEFKEKFYSIESKSEVAKISKTIIDSHNFDKEVTFIFQLEANKIYNHLNKHIIKNNIERLLLDGGFVKNNLEFYNIIKNSFDGKISIDLIEWGSSKNNDPLKLL